MIHIRMKNGDVVVDLPPAFGSEPHDEVCTFSRILYMQDNGHAVLETQCGNPVACCEAAWISVLAFSSRESGVAKNINSCLVCVLFVSTISRPFFSSNGTSFLLGCRILSCKFLVKKLPPHQCASFFVCIHHDGSDQGDTGDCIEPVAVEESSLCLG